MILQPEGLTRKHPQCMVSSRKLPCPRVLDDGHGRTTGEYAYLSSVVHWH